ncbi:Olfactory receptor 478 [Sciurus carolinensis]|uniref:Olfactory receptor 478 n=1 Tax=Sciurus carolinensis TaxID=30640 RepID=A0AA41T7T9_SCICA|nr:Olfactory receptor 478 [Sciurus carolinensis]
MGSFFSSHCPMDPLVNGNLTAVTEFILLGLTDDPVLRVFLFVTVLCIYLVTLSGNLSTIILIRASSQLHHPMYFFLSHLAFADIGYSSSVTPNMLVNFLVERNTISYVGCAIQLGSAVFFGTVECFLLAVMAYDRFVAICNPLLYSTKMSSHVYLQLLVVTYTVCVIAVSYVYILTTVLRMRSPEGRHKAFSTCTSHLTAVTLYYGTIIFIYVMPKSSFSTDQNKVVSVFYTVVIPMLNPLIYRLRNQEIKGALKRELSKKIFS